MVPKSITMGAEHEKHMMSCEMATRSAMVFSCTSMPMTVANRVITVLAFSFVQYEAARSELNRVEHTLMSTTKFLGDH